MKNPNLCGEEHCQNAYTKILRVRSAPHEESTLSVRLCNIHAQEMKPLIEAFNKNLSRGEAFLKDRSTEDA